MYSNQDSLFARKVQQFPIATPSQQLQQLLLRHSNSPQVIELKNWLTRAPSLLDRNRNPPILQYQLPNNETISCVLWNGNHFITGTDIVKILLFRFQSMMNIKNINVKKFEEGVFSDLRNLKVNEDAILEEPRSRFLEFLYKHNCIRTQKKQKVFVWFKVKHDDLFMEAMKRFVKRNAPEILLHNFLIPHLSGQQQQQQQAHPIQKIQSNNSFIYDHHYAAQQALKPPIPDIMHNIQSNNNSREFISPALIQQDLSFFEEPKKNTHDITEDSFFKNDPLFSADTNSFFDNISFMD